MMELFRGYCNYLEQNKWQEEESKSAEHVSESDSGPFATIACRKRRELNIKLDFVRKIGIGLEILYKLAMETDAKIREEDQIGFILATAEENRDFGEYYFEKRCGDSCMWERCKSLGKLAQINNI